MRIFALSDTGEVRPSNQDFYAVGYDADYCYAIVCDGMGGHNGGNVASEMAVNIIRKHLASKLSGELYEEVVKGAVLGSIRAANDEIFRKSKESEELSGMGTTAVVAVEVNDRVYIAHVGDSRAYLVNNGVSKQITVDHSVVQELISMGKLTEEEAKNYPGKNIITRAVGVDSIVDADLQIIDLEEDDILVICTDGLSNYVPEKELAKIASSNDIEQSAEILVELAKQRGGADNITVALMSK